MSLQSLLILLCCV